MKRYLVTGGAGFIGSNLVAALVRGEHDVIVVDDFLKGSWENIQEACDRCEVPFRGRILPIDYRALDPSIIQGVDGVVHLAAITDTLVTDDRVVLGVNASGAGELLERCAEAGVPAVYASSAAVYGLRDAGELLSVGDHLQPLNLYGFSKLALEAEYARLKPGTQIVGLRYFNVFGPGEGHKGRMASMVRQLAVAAASGTVTLFAPGNQARDWIHVDDVVAATLRALEAPPGVYNVGSGEAISFADLVPLVSGGREPEIVWRPIPAEIAPRYQSFTLAGPAFVPGWSPPADRTRERIVEFAREVNAGSKLCAD